MGYVYGRTDSYAIGLWLLSVTAALTLVLTADRRPHVTARSDRRADRRRDHSSHGMDGALADALVRSRRFFTQGHRLRRPADAVPGRAAARPTTSTGTAGATTRWSAPRTA